jgi:acetoin utilization deacetylase AcuC-like enzyme
MTTPAHEWSDAVEDIVRRIETLETDYIDGSYVSTSDAKKIGEDIQNLLTTHTAHLVERIEAIKEDQGSYQKDSDSPVRPYIFKDVAIDIVKSKV